MGARTLALLRSVHHVLRKRIPYYYETYRLLLTIRGFLKSFEILRTSSAIRYILARTAKYSNDRPLVELQFRRGGVAWIRRATSDAQVFEQVFLFEHYKRAMVNSPVVIFDAGANIGLSAMYFLRQSADAVVACIEPDTENYLLLEKNLRAFGPRIQCFQGALWNRKTRLRVDRDRSPGNEWAVMVCEDADGVIQGLDLFALMNKFGFKRIDLLKVDIEGAEEKVFQGNPSWPKDVHTIAIELHGPAAKDIVMKGMSKYRYVFVQDREISIFEDITAA